MLTERDDRFPPISPKDIWYDFVDDRPDVRRAMWNGHNLHMRMIGDIAVIDLFPRLPEYHKSRRVVTTMAESMIDWAVNKKHAHIISAISTEQDDAELTKNALNLHYEEGSDAALRKGIVPGMWVAAMSTMHMPSEATYDGMDALKQALTYAIDNPIEQTVFH